MPLRPRALTLSAIALSGGLDAQARGEAPRPTAHVGRVAEAQAPRIDGHGEDPCWRDAPAIGELTMVEPWLGRAPTERTVVKLLHDRGNLYIGLWCHHRDPSSIRATQRARDAELDPDDRVEILLDPFENRRTAYFFQIGAGGSIGDILISGNGGKFDKPWDTIWSGAASVTAEGWMAEIAIPFRSLPRPEGKRTWGFNLSRRVRASNEEYQWANASQAVPFYRVSECGTIEGLLDLEGGIGLEVVPYVTAGVARDRSAADDSWAFDPDAGGEIYYRLSPSVTLAATVLTDFAETEADGRQINLNRFPLFFPEKRDFFLEGTGYFSFGASTAGNTTFLPFFTRRIGLAQDGSKVPILAGVKLLGEAGPFEIGVLDVQADATAVVDEENLAVARLKYALAEQTTVGFLGTHGNPASTGDNTVFGGDFHHREPQFLGDLDLRIAVDAAGSFGAGTAADGESYGIDLQSRGSEWEFQAGSRWIAENFDPALGFVPRRGIRSWGFESAYRPRLAEGGAIRRWDFGAGLNRIDDWDGEPQNLGFEIALGAQMHSADEMSVFASRSFERVDADFDLFGGSTTVFAGDYWGTRGGLWIQTSQGRPWSSLLMASTGDFFDGHSTGFEGELEWRAMALLHFAVEYRTDMVELGPGRNFTTQIAATRLDFHFSPALSLRNFVQFDNESNLLGWQSRMRWIYSPGCDFFAVLGTSWLREDDAMVPTEQSLELKVSHSFRF